MENLITVDDRCIRAFRELKSKRYVNTVIYRLNERMDACVVERQDNLIHEDLLPAMPPGDPLIVAYDLAFATVDGMRKNKILLINRLPKRVASRQTALYAQAYGDRWRPSSPAGGRDR
ncbi:hypothetical protein ACIRQH_03990 [Streptomyces sp. NPDC102279]|uniref:hypothetical protein n=1 Tax=Streptomyces sp. NPDC102279 TaxID=3366153 RepID=UPI003817A68F